jgi:hypothetical protein
MRLTVGQPGMASQRHGERERPARMLSCQNIEIHYFAFCRSSAVPPRNSVLPSSVRTSCA